MNYCDECSDGILRYNDGFICKECASPLHKGCKRLHLERGHFKTGLNPNNERVGEESKPFNKVRQTGLTVEQLERWIKSV